MIEPLIKYLCVGVIPLVFVGIIYPPNGATSWVELIVIVDLFPLSNLM